MPSRRHRSGFASLLFASLLLAGAPAAADEYQSKDSAHPLRLAAYVLHPVGVVLDTLIARPAHWLVSRGPMKTLFGHAGAIGNLSHENYEIERHEQAESPEG